MAIDKVRSHLKQWNRDGDIQEFEVSNATVDLAAQALGVEPARIAKSLTFRKDGEGCFLVVAAGDVKVDNSKFHSEFGLKARMLNPEEVRTLVGHEVGGVCPFAVGPLVEICLDESLKRFASVFPACGSDNSGIELTCAELEEYSGSRRWVDVCKQRSVPEL